MWFLSSSKRFIIYFIYRWQGPQSFCHRNTTNSFIYRNLLKINTLFLFQSPIPFYFLWQLKVLDLWGDSSRQLRGHCTWLTGLGFLQKCLSATKQPVNACRAIIFYTNSSLMTHLLQSNKEVNSPQTSLLHTSFSDRQRGCLHNSLWCKQTKGGNKTSHLSHKKGKKEK